MRTLEIDCAITSTRFSDPKLESVQLHREDYVFVGSTGLLRRMPLKRPQHALRHTLIDATPDMPLFRYFRDADGGGDPLRFLRASFLGSIEAIRHQVLEGSGVAILPLYLVRKDLQRRQLIRLFPSVELAHDFFRLVFRAIDPRRSVFEGIARTLLAAPLR
ncbi:MAG: hypothetical protein NVSMB1_24570 [Polyangiales bacterium]